MRGESKFFHIFFITRAFSTLSPNKHSEPRYVWVVRTRILSPVQHQIAIIKSTTLPRVVFFYQMWYNISMRCIRFFREGTGHAIFIT